MHHNFATVRHKVMQFSAKCSERNCLLDKGQCLNMAIVLQLASEQFENKINSKIFKANSWYKQSSR